MEQPGSYTYYEWETPYERIERIQDLIDQVPELLTVYECYISNDAFSLRHENVFRTISIFNEVVWQYRQMLSDPCPGDCIDRNFLTDLRNRMEGKRDIYEIVCCLTYILMRLLEPNDWRAALCVKKLRKHFRDSPFFHPMEEALQMVLGHEIKMTKVAPFLSPMQLEREVINFMEPLRSLANDGWKPKWNNMWESVTYIPEVESALRRTSRESRCLLRPGNDRKPLEIHFCRDILGSILCYVLSINPQNPLFPPDLTKETISLVLTGKKRDHLYPFLSQAPAKSVCSSLDRIFSLPSAPSSLPR